MATLYKEIFKYYLPLFLLTVLFFESNNILNRITSKSMLFNSMADLIVLGLFINTVIFLYSIIKLKQRLSFTTFTEFESNPKFWINNKLLDKEVKAQYLEIHKFKENGFSNILEVIHKVNILNKSKKDFKKTTFKKPKNFFRLIDSKVLWAINIVLAIVTIYLVGHLKNSTGDTIAEFLNNIYLPFEIIIMVFSLLLNLTMILSTRNEIYNMKTYKECRKIRTYQNLYTDSDISKDFIIMGEFANNIEKQLKKDNLDEITMLDFNNNVQALNNHKDEIDDIYQNYLLDNDKEANITEYQKKLYYITDFSKFRE